MSVESIFRWHDNVLVPLEYCDMTDTRILVADSWLTSDGKTLALGLHRDRFLNSLSQDARASTNADEFWDAAVGQVPRDGDWFPRVELQDRAGALLLVLRLRSAPDRTNNVVVATWPGDDPRTQPRVKGPDLAAMLRIRTSLQPTGAGEGVLVSPEGYLVEGAFTALMWWRGDILCYPSDELARVDSVTVRSVLALTAALGVETFAESVTSAEIADTELWALNSLHGIRIVTRWVDGPQLAELPGRLGTWRARLDALRKPS
jgi:branched-subunit amino acid aminotransferase/4-amino-4-deoxychorismate lyase